MWGQVIFLCNEMMRWCDGYFWCYQIRAPNPRWDVSDLTSRVFLNKKSPRRSPKLRESFRKKHPHGFCRLLSADESNSPKWSRVSCDINSPALCSYALQLPRNCRCIERWFWGKHLRILRKVVWEEHEKSKLVGKWSSDEKEWYMEVNLNKNKWQVVWNRNSLKVKEITILEWTGVFFWTVHHLLTKF